MLTTSGRGSHPAPLILGKQRNEKEKGKKPEGQVGRDPPPPPPSPLAQRLDRPLLTMLASAMFANDSTYRSTSTNNGPTEIQDCRI